jgi:large subunit ribosomal protein L19
MTFMPEIKIKFTPINVEERKGLGVHAGDTVKVWQKVMEKDKTRLQAFDGIVLSVKHGTEAGAMFTVRKVVDGIGVERIFPLYSPMIDKVEILKRAKLRRSKLYHIRDKAAKEIRKRMKSELMQVDKEVEEVMAEPRAEKEEKAEIK